MTTYVLVHGAWHTGDLFEEVAAPIRAAGHTVHLPTIAGNRPGDAKTTGLSGRSRRSSTTSPPTTCPTSSCSAIPMAG